MFRRRSADMSAQDVEKTEKLKNIIENCTSEMLMGVNWETNMELIDEINRTASEPV